MLRIFKKSVIALLVLIMLLSISSQVFAGDTEKLSERTYGGETAEIRTPEEFLAIRDNPSGKYELKSDIDLKDYDYVPFAFSGYLNGNGFSVLNVKISRFSDETRTVYDCNHKPYETHFAGLFGILEGAYIEDLTILSEEISLDCDDECVFTGGLAGYMYDSYAEDIIILSQRASLSTSGKCWGTGGLAGYGGESRFYDCSVSSELTCTDEDVKFKDEQFMGGAYALGYIDLDHIDVTISGYDADHGYVHDGGLVGAYYKYNGNEGWGTISGCTVNGKITFFEDNKNRRAYCAPYIGEVMHWSLDMDNNRQSFTRDEIYDYSAELGPHFSCEKPLMEDIVSEPDYESYGYTVHRCSTCGYTYTDCYTHLRIKAEKADIIFTSLSGKDILYEGDKGHITVNFEPFNASPLEFELVCEGAEAAESAPVYSITSDSFAEAEVSFDNPGKVKIKALADGNVIGMLELTVKTHKAYIWDTFGVIIVTCIGVAACIAGIFINSAKGKKRA